jgi:hypothetical protein
MKTKIYLFIISGVLAISGCYTVLRHPEVPNQDEMGNVYQQDINTNDNCYKCHSQSADQTYDYDRYMNYCTHPQVSTEYSNYNSPRWDSYYSVPWWFRPPTVTVEAGSKSQPEVNKTTSNTGNNVRPTGSVRGDVNISAPAATRSNDGTSNTTSSSNSDKKQDNQTSTRSNNSNNNNQSDSSKGNSNSNTNDDKRNSGSTRGK